MQRRRRGKYKRESLYWTCFTRTSRGKNARTSSLSIPDDASGAGTQLMMDIDIEEPLQSLVEHAASSGNEEGIEGADRANSLQKSNISLGPTMLREPLITGDSSIQHESYSNFLPLLVKTESLMAPNAEPHLQLQAANSEPSLRDALLSQVRTIPSAH